MTHKTNKQHCLGVNHRLKSKRLGNRMFAIFDADKQVAPASFSAQKAWANARDAICCPFPVGSKIVDSEKGKIYEITPSTFGYPHFYKDDQGNIAGGVADLFIFADPSRFVFADKKNCK